MNQQVRAGLKRLHDAVHEAITTSDAVAIAMQDLENLGQSPSFSVDLELHETAQVSQNATWVEDFGLTCSDQHFLRAIGIAESP
jgi:hypothetical protein